MAASVLGKRSRQSTNADDGVPVLPARKRRTRLTAPQIYEDQNDCCNSVTVNNSEPLQASPRRIQPFNTRHTKSRYTPCDELSHASDTVRFETAEIQDTALLCQDENLPPVVETPTTRRFKDLLGLRSPKTPKHRVRLGGIPLTPKSRQPTPTKSRTLNPFSAARQVFTQASGPTQLVGRDVERRELDKFISQAIHTQSGGCTYVNGPPGTGKSALAQAVIDTYAHHDGLCVASINCVSLRTAAEVFDRILQEIAPGTTMGKMSAKQHLSKLFLARSKPKPKSYLVLLDEIDSLISTGGEVISTIFELALHKSSTLILVGIANALDLTDRFLPRLKARGLQPQLLPFVPYTASQVSSIIAEKLKSTLPAGTTAAADFVPLLQPAAIQLCGKKIASQTGDLRKAFSLVRRVLDQMEQETTQKLVTASPSKQPLGDNTNLSGVDASSSESVMESMTTENAPRASIAHVARVAASIFNNGTTTRLHGLNLQQKAVLCSLVGGETRRVERDLYATPSKSSQKVPTVKDLFVKYTLLCKRDDGLLQPLKDTEFRDVVSSLETLGLVSEYKGRASSFLTPTSTPSRAGRGSDDKQIMSAVSQKEMRESLVGAGADLLRRLLEEAQA